MTQYARPTALTTDEWVGAYTDMADNDDGTYLASPQLPVEAQTFLCDLGEVTQPAVTTGHQIVVRCNLYPAGSDDTDLVLTLENSDDDSVIKTMTVSAVPDDMADQTFTLSEAEVGDIHSYAGLRVRGHAKTATGTEVAFVWEAVVGATSYILQIGTASGNYNRCNSNVGNVTYKIVTLKAGTYYSRVVPVGAGSATAEQTVVVS